VKRKCTLLSAAAVKMSYLEGRKSTVIICLSWKFPSIVLEQTSSPEGLNEKISNSPLEFDKNSLSTKQSF